MESLHDVLEEHGVEESDGSCPEANTVHPRRWQAIACYMVDKIDNNGDNSNDEDTADALGEDNLAILATPVMGEDDTSKK